MANTINDRRCRPTKTVDQHFDYRHWWPTKLRATASE